MASRRVRNFVMVAACTVPFVAAQDQATCYGPGSVVGAVVGTLIVTLGFLVSGFFLYRTYWKNRKGKHLMLMTDSENPHDQYAFDNPCFREATPVKHNIRDEKQSSKPEKTKWPGWPPVHSFGKEKKTEKVTSMDDSCLQDARLKVVNLKSHDFTGLGFNICGNMRDGIFVKDVLHRGPAFESGCINTGDRIDSVCISFRNMVFEDALTILSYASPYDVQVQVENDSCSRPSTLMRSKRESNALKNCSDRILHPKFSRSQSFSHLNEMDKGNNRKLPHQKDLLLEKNWINHSLNKSQDFTDCPTIKISPKERITKTQKSPSVAREERSPTVVDRDRESESRQTKSADPQNKLQKFGIKVLPIGLGPRSGTQPEIVDKKSGRNSTTGQDVATEKGKPRDFSPGEGKISRSDERDAGMENARAMFSKGFLNLKEKIGQNGLGKRKKEGEVCPEEEEEEARNARPDEEDRGGRESECPVPKLRSSVARGVKHDEQNYRSHANVPEEVSRAGNVARNNRKSLLRGPECEEVDGTIKMERGSDGESSSDGESMKDDPKRLKRSKGKAPAPPKQVTTSKDVNEIKKESEIPNQDTGVFKPGPESKSLKDEADVERNPRPSYESDSDAEPMTASEEGPNMKIELNSSQVTVHQSPTGDTNEDDVEPNRKAASLGDLSKLDSEQPLSVVLERAVSLDLTEGTTQNGKKRKAPLPPSEEFPPAFDDLNYRKEARLEGLNTFQRRLKKSSDFGTLEDALSEGPKSLEIEVNRHSPLSLTETHNHNIQEFSSWLAECRRPKTTEALPTNDWEGPKTNSTSLVNINSPDHLDDIPDAEPGREYQGRNVSFSVNGKNMTDFEISSSSENANFPAANSRTVLVISRPGSLEVSGPEKALPGDDSKKDANGTNEHLDRREPLDDVAAPAPAKLSASPPPPSGILSSPLSSTLTYITEIKVSTSDRGGGNSEPGNPSPSFVGERIQKFDSHRGFDVQPPKYNCGEPSKIPVRTMKSETGQKVLATIQSLAKESPPVKSPEVEYARRVASLFSNPHSSRGSFTKNDTVEAETPRSDLSGPPKPSKDYSPTRKVPPVVPPRKMETSLTSKSTVAVEPSSPPGESRGRNVVTFSSFVGKSQNEDCGPGSSVSFKIKDRVQVNGGEDGSGPQKTSATRIILEGDQNEEGLRRGHPS